MEAKFLPIFLTLLPTESLKNSGQYFFTIVLFSVPLYKSGRASGKVTKYKKYHHKYLYLKIVVFTPFQDLACLEHSEPVSKTHRKHLRHLPWLPVSNPHTVIRQWNFQIN